jgi:hypothetical protein
MHRFFFDLSDQDQIEPDCDGVELPGTGAARIEAVRVVAAMMREEAGADGAAVTMFVRDENGSLFTVRGTIVVVSPEGRSGGEAK